MPRRPPPSPALDAAVERVLAATGRQYIVAGADLKRLRDLLDRTSAPHSIVFKTEPRLHDRGRRRDENNAAKRAAAQAASLHELLAGKMSPFFERQVGRGFPVHEFAAEIIPNRTTRSNKPRLASFEATINGLREIHSSLERFIREGGSVLIVTPGKSYFEKLVTEDLLPVYNGLVGQPAAAAGRASWAEHSGAGGPLVRFVLSVLGEVGVRQSTGKLYSAESVAAALRTAGPNPRRRSRAKISDK